MKTATKSLQDKLSHINSHADNPVFTKLYEASALIEAKASDARKTKFSPLDGKIISIKDLFDVEGEVTWAGSKILKEAPVARKTSPIVTKLREAGSVIIGKTNMSEFAFHGLGINHTFGTPLNAVNPKHVTGGSSSGAAASVVLDMCDIAIGTDTGGSIRLPASFNGCVGFKPSQYRVTREGAFPLSHSLDSIGGLARSVQDCIDCDSILSGQDWSHLTAKPLSHFKFALATGGLVDEASDEMQQAFHATIAHLEKAGAKFVKLDMQPLLDEVMALLSVVPIVTVEAAAIHKDWMEQHPQDYYEPVLARISMGAKITGANYIRGMWKRSELINKYNAIMEGFDAIFLPTTLVTAPTIVEVEVSLEAFLKHNARALRNCTFGNILDVCGLSLPCIGVSNMPVGLQIMGANGKDEAVLAASLAVETALRA